MADETEYTKSAFVHLHSHSQFSILDGVCSVDQYASECHKRGYPAQALTEHGHMASVPDMYFAAQKYGIKPIQACEIYYNDNELNRQYLAKNKVSIKKIEEEDYELSQRMRRNRHLTVLVKNEVGLRNLLELTTMAYEWGFYYQPRIWFAKLAQYHEGLIVLSGCLNGPVAFELRQYAKADAGEEMQHSANHYLTNAIKYLKKFKELFKEDYYVELQMPGLPELYDYVVFQKLVELADLMGIKTVLANDCWSPNINVQTSNGSKRLDEIRVGDMVWTHKGRLKEVINVGKRKRRQGEKIYGYFGRTDITCTGNHKLLFKSPNGDVGFSEVQHVPDGSFVHVAGVELAQADLKTITLSDYITDSRCVVKDGLVYPRGGKSINPISNEVELSDELLWLMGLYIADGCVDAGYRLSYALNISSKNYVDRIRTFFRSYGLKTSDARKVSDNGISIRVCSSGFSNLMSICGRGVSNKCLPPFWSKLSQRQLIILLRGYWDGDGGDCSRTSFTISYKLHSDLMHAFASLKIGFTVSRRCAKDVIMTKKDGRTVKTHHKEGFHLYLTNYNLKVLGYDTKDSNFNRNRTKWHIDEYGVWIPNPFKVVDTEQNEFWCIEVEDDHTFLMGMTSSNSHYMTREEFKFQKIMMAIAQDLPLDSPDLFHVNSDEQYMKTRPELYAMFSSNRYSDGMSVVEFDRMCDSTLEIADKVENIKIDLSPKIPDWSVIDVGVNADDKLRDLVYESLKKRGKYDDTTKYLVDGENVTYREQADKELDRFISKGFSSYFLITRDLVTFGRSKGWPFGPRGSAGGSLVCFLLGISNINPMVWGPLSFDRFLSPVRGGFFLKATMD